MDMCSGCFLVLHIFASPPALCFGGDPILFESARIREADDPDQEGHACL